MSWVTNCPHNGPIIEFLLSSVVLPSLPFNSVIARDKALSFGSFRFSKPKNSIKNDVLIEKAFLIVNIYYFRSKLHFRCGISSEISGNFHLPRWVIQRGSPSKSETLSEFSSHGQ